MNRSALLFAGVLFVGISAYGQPTSGTWSNNGPEGVSTPKLYIDSSNPSTLYLTPHVNLYKSTDGGESWKRILTGNNFVISPSNPNLLLYSGTDGPVRSEDEGRTWTRIQYPPGWNLAVPVTFLFDPQNSTIVYEVQDLIVGRPCFCSIGQIYKSVDGGQTWSLDFETSSEFGAYPKVAGAAIDSRSTVWVFGSALYRRLAGESRSIVLSVPITTLAIDPRDPPRLYAGGPDGLSLSANGGDSWTPTLYP